MLRRRLLIPLLGLMMPPVFGAHPLVTEDIGVQGTGKRQVELNTDWLRQVHDTQHVGAFAYTYGANDNTDLIVTLPFALSSPSGMNDLSLGAKWRFFEAGPIGTALRTDLSLPAGNETRGLGIGYPALALTLVGSVETGPWQLHANAAVTLNRYRMESERDTRRNLVWRASAAVLYALNDKWQLALDSGVSQDVMAARGSLPTHLLAGVLYSPRPNIDLDAGVRFNRHCGDCGHEGKRQFGTGLTWRF